MRIRLAIAGPSPCHLCYAACCRRSVAEFAVLLEGDERRRFAPFAVDVPIRQPDGSVITERVLPYTDDGRCQFLENETGRCSIYEQRPVNCRRFECVPRFNREGLGRHDLWLSGNLRVAAMLDSLQPGTE
jgi:Fe-S-cluster containining protein